MRLVRLLHLADSGFPTGGFVHSGGLEAAWQLDRCGGDLAGWLRASLHQYAQQALPLVVAAVRAPDRLIELDALADAWLANATANRASRAQGAAWLTTAGTAFPEAGIAALRTRLRRAGSPGHLAPVLGAILAALDLDEATARRLATFLHLRGQLSAAIRLNAIGPQAAQAVQATLEADLEAAATAPADDPDAIAATAPMIELAAMAHDRLYSRLFSS